MKPLNRNQWGKAMTARSLAIALVATMVPGAATVGAVELKSLRGDVGIEELDSASAEAFRFTEGQRMERAYRQQPPLIPHAIDKYEIDLKVNQCLRCHDWPYNVKENAPKVSETHYTARDGTRLDTVAGTRWFCTQCHVPQADAQPLVENTFEPVKP